MNRPILKTRTILNQFKRNEKMTLELMAVKYGMEYADFLDQVKKVVGRENFSDMESLNAKRLKAGKGKPAIIATEEDTIMKARLRNNLLEQKASIQSITIPETAKEENEMSSNIKKLQDKMQAVTTIISTVSGQLKDLNAKHETTRTLLSEVEQKLNSLRLEEVEQELEIQEKNAELENAKAEKAQLQSELDKLTLVVLIAPRYKGGSRSKEMKMVSTKGRDGIEEQRVPKEEWISKPTWEAFVNSGHRERELFEEDFEFVQLVLKYQCEGKKFVLRANETIRKMIAFEGGEV